MYRSTPLPQEAAFFIYGVTNMPVRIETIDDVLPHISFEDGFVVSKRDDYTVIDYIFANEKTFANPVAMECRGLKFGTDGRLIARPFHKFFNIGEREAPEAVDWSRPHLVADKLDGSMVHPCLLNGEMVFMTRMGISPQAKAAFAAASDAVKALSADMLADGVTPIFEFTSPDNRIVIEYDETRLTLLALRETISGVYRSHTELEQAAMAYGVPPVQTFGQVEDVSRFIRDGRLLSGVEGYVVVFDDGHRLKLKSDGYVLRHKALAGVAYEKNLLALIAEDALDDVLPLLHTDVAARVRTYRDRLMVSVAARLAEVERFVAAQAGVSRRDFAMALKPEIDPRLHKLAFGLLDGWDGREILMKIVAWAGHSENRVAQVRDLFGLEWSGTDLVLRDA
jgi:RNA ligase